MLHFPACRTLITSHFSLPNEELQQTLSFEQLETHLTQIINYLLDKNMNALMTAMYKIDLSEATFKSIVCSNPPHSIGKSLAQEVIKRELKKVESRRKYSTQTMDNTQTS